MNKESAFRFVLLSTLVVLCFSAAFKLSARSPSERLQAVTDLAAEDQYSAQSSTTPPAHTIIFVFSLTDCSICLNDLNVLNRITSRPENRLRVIGAAYGLTPGERTAIHDLGIGFPIVDAKRLDRVYDVTRKLDSNKPWKVVLDAKGDVVEIRVSETSIQGQEAYAQQITEAL